MPYNISLKGRKKNMLFVKERLSSWIQAAIILVVGILCIVAGAAIGNNDPEAAKNTIDAMSVVIGIVLIVVGSLSLILSVLVAVLAKKGFAAVAAPGAILVALGASILVWKYFYNFIDILIKVVPFLLIALGVIVLADAVFTYILALKAKEGKKALLGLIVGCLVAVAAIVLGALCIGTEPVIKYGAQLIVFGIVVCLVACFQILLTFVKLPTAVVVVSKKEEK